MIVSNFGGEIAVIDLYYWPTPNGKKVSIMLEECELEYNAIPVNIGRGDQFAAEFLDISPNNRIPAIVADRHPGCGRLRATPRARMHRAGAS